MKIVERAIPAIKISLRSKFILGILILECMLMSAVVLIVENQMRGSITEEFLLRATSIGRSVAAVNTNFITTYNYLGIEQNLSSLLEEECLRYAVVQLFDGEVAAYIGDKNLEASLLKGAVNDQALAAEKVLVQYIDLQESLCEVAVPVLVDAEKWASVRVGFSLEKIQSAIHSTRIALFTLGVIALGLGCLASLVFARRITRPIVTLVQSVESICAGNYDHEIKIDTHDEIGYLGNRFSAMQETLKENIHLLLTANHELRDANDRLTNLFQVSQKMNPLQSQEKLYELILQATTSATRALGGVLTLNDQEGQPQVVAATWTKDAGDENWLTGLIQEEIRQTKAFDFISLSKQPQFSIDKANSTLPLFKARMESHPEVDLIVIPLRLGKDLTGFINIHRESCLGEITASEMQATSILLSHAASAIENKRLFLQLEEAYLSSVKSLAKTLELKDEYTHGHSERVAEICLKIGKRMNLGEASLKVLYNAALLHDIGKIGVLETILNKSSTLDDEEYRLIKRHPELGEQILSAIPSLQEERRIVRHHHEREDGRGYPDGLYGNKLLLSEKIIILADAFDAMNSKRPYRSPLPPEVIKAEIERMKGAQFDPEVADVFLEMFHDFIDLPSQNDGALEKIISIEDFKGLAIGTGKKK